jgi:ATP-dependent Zn protease
MAAPTQKEIDTAYHEAAHAIAHLDMGYPLEYVSIVSPQEGKLGGTKGTIAPEELESKLRDRAEFAPAEVQVLRDEMTNYLMGELAEARLHKRTYRLDPHNADG